MTDHDTLLHRPKSLYLDGGWKRAEGAPLTVLDPATGTSLATLATATTEDVCTAVGAACAAFPGWRARDGRARGDLLTAFARGLERRRERLVALQMRNNGKPRDEAATDVADAIATFDYYAGLAAGLDARQDTPVALPDAGYEARTRFEPLGAVGMIVPWNFPLVTSAWKLAPALAAGCTVVIKTSEYTPLAELVYGDIAEEAALPAGVLNILTGAGGTGAVLTRDPRLAKLSFTGSNAVGARVMAAAAEHCVPVSLELGGKSPIVVFADADVEHAVDCIMAGIFYNCGQMCSATSRLLLERRAAPAVLARLVARTRALRIGSPGDPATEMGPLTTAPQHRKVAEWLERARADDLHCLVGGTPPADAGGGFFAEPSIYGDVPTNHPLWREEVFGPVLAARCFDTEEEALALANDCEYGLVSTVVSGDGKRARRVAAGMDAGHVWINSPQVIFPHTAWGGFKRSGIGRELGPWGLAAYQGVKNITLPAAAA